MRRWEDQACARVVAALGMDGFARLEALFDSQRRGDLAALRAEPGAVGVDTVLGELVKLSGADIARIVAVFDGIEQRVVES